MINRFYRTLRRMRQASVTPGGERRRGEDRRQLVDRREDIRSGEQLAGRRKRERRYGHDVQTTG